MPKLKVNDINLYYESYGKGEPIIFVAGYTADHLTWQNLIDSYANEYQMIVFDNRGCGQSDSPDMPYTVDMMANDVIGLAQQLELNSFHVVGNSMGGAIVQTLAHKYPEFIRTAIISNSFTTIDIKFEITAKAWLQMIKDNVPVKLLAEQSFAWVFSSAFLTQPGQFERLTELTLANPYPMTEVGLRNQLNALITFHSETWVSKIRNPPLIIGTDEDIITSEKATRQLANLIPNAQYALIKNAGHLPHIEHPEEFNQLVKGFIKKHS